MCIELIATSTERDVPSGTIKDLIYLCPSILSKAQVEKRPGCTAVPVGRTGIHFVVILQIHFMTPVHDCLFL